MGGGKEEEKKKRDGNMWQKAVKIKREKRRDLKGCRGKG